MVFISYSHRDITLIDKLEKELKNKGISYTTDQKNFDQSESITRSIIKNIKYCDAFILLISDASVKSNWVFQEIVTAKSFEKVFFPILNCERKEAEEKLPIDLNNIKTFKMDNLEKLANEIEIINTKRNNNNKFESVFDEITYLYYHCNNIGSFNADQSEFTVEQPHVYNFWKDCIYRTKLSWEAISYTKGNEAWKHVKRRNMLSVAQLDRILNDCKIERTFLVDDDKEYMEILPTMIEQSLIGIKVGHLKITKVDSKIKDFINTYDFALIDDKYIFKIRIDNRIVESASLINCYKQYQDATSIYSALFLHRHRTPLHKSDREGATIVQFINFITSSIGNLDIKNTISQ